jgi:hypothetical protein
MRDALNVALGRDYIQVILENYLRSDVNYDEVVKEVEWFSRLDPGDIRVEDSLWQRTIEVVRGMFRLKNKGHCHHYNELFDNEELRSTLPLSHSPGLPFTDDGTAKTKGEAMEIIRQEMRTRIHHCKVKKNKLLLSPVKISIRNHMINSPLANKVRGVYAYPTDAWMVEVMLYKDLIKKYNEEDTAYGLNVVPILGGLNRIHVSKAKIGIDISKFDKSVAKQTIGVAFDIIQENIDWTVYADGGIPDSSALLHLHKVMEDYFINTPMVTPDGGVYVKRSGVPSGTHLTNLVDSIAMALMTVYVCMKLAIPVDYSKCKFMGDDAYIVTLYDDYIPGFEIKQFAEEAWFGFGQVVNDVKSKMLKNNESEFAGYEIEGREDMPHRNIHGLVAGLLLPETPDRCADDALRRLIGISYAGGFSKKFLAACKIAEDILVPQCTKEFAPKRDILRFMRVLGVPIEYQTSVCTPERFKSLVTQKSMGRLDHLIYYNDD